MHFLHGRRRGYRQPEIILFAVRLMCVMLCCGVSFLILLQLIRICCFFFLFRYCSPLSLLCAATPAQLSVSGLKNRCKSIANNNIAPADLAKCAGKMSTLSSRTRRYIYMYISIDRFRGRPSLQPGSVLGSHRCPPSQIYKS